MSTKVSKKSGSLARTRTAGICTRGLTSYSRFSSCSAGPEFNNGMPLKYIFMMTLQEKLNIDKVMSNWKKEALDRNAYPIIAISMRKSGGGKDVFIHGP